MPLPASISGSVMESRNPQFTPVPIPCPSTSLDRNTLDMVAAYSPTAASLPTTNRISGAQSTTSYSGILKQSSPSQIPMPNVKVSSPLIPKKTGLFHGTWWPVMTVDTTAPSYWLNWRFLLCAIWIVVAMVFSALIIWRYEGHNKSKNRPNGGDAWGTCSKSIRPVWLLAFRIVAFCFLLALILADTIVHSIRIFQFYTQWTFTLVTIYFGLGSSISIHGFLHHHHKVDSESGFHVAPTLGENGNMHSTNRSLNNYDDANCKTASVWEYALQIIFQMCAGAVVLTDAVFWLVIYPFLTDDDYRLHFLVVCMHSVNAVFLLGDALLNCMRFPFFRIAYFVLWTCIFVVVHWIIHACVSISWPYPFLDLSSPYAPIWYLGVGLLHLPCYGIFTLILKIKQCCLSKIASQ